MTLDGEKEKGLSVFREVRNMVMETAVKEMREILRREEISGGWWAADASYMHVYILGWG